MTRRRCFLLLTILFSLLFIALVAAGSYLLSIHSKSFGVAAFLFAFAAAFGQITSLAFYIRQVARDAASHQPVALNRHDRSLLPYRLPQLRRTRRTPFGHRRNRGVFILQQYAGLSRQQPARYGARQCRPA